MQSATFLYAFDNHTGHLADFTLRVFLHHSLQTDHTTVGIAVVQIAQTVDEDELRAVLTQREPLCRKSGVAADDVVPIVLEGLIGVGIERVFDMFTETGILSVVGVAQQNGPFTLREMGLQLSETTVCHRLVALSGI